MFFFEKDGSTLGTKPSKTLGLPENRSSNNISKKETSHFCVFLFYFWSTRHQFAVCFLRKGPGPVSLASGQVQALELKFLELQLEAERLEEELATEVELEDGSSTLTTFGVDEK